MRLIGITGFKHSGKDTTFDAIKKAEWDRWSGHKVVRVAFADKLKELGALALGIEGDPIEEMDKAKERWEITLWEPDGLEPFYATTGRKYLQNIGNEARGLFGDTFWINQVLPEPRAQMESMHEEGRTAYEEEAFFRRHYPGVDILVVTDVRYENEGRRVKELGGEVWKVERPGTESDGHASEIPISDELVDVVINNGGTIEDLFQKVKSTL